MTGLSWVEAKDGKPTQIKNEGKETTRKEKDVSKKSQTKSKKKVTTKQKTF